jgi:hypothetical protein
MIGRVNPTTYARRPAHPTCQREALTLLGAALSAVGFLAAALVGLPAIGFAVAGS